MSAFHDILERLVREDAAAGAIFVDDSGETVDLATVEDREQMRLLAAYAGIYLRQAQRFCSVENIGAVSFLSIRCEGLLLHAQRLKEGYSLILVTRGHHLEALSRQRLAAAAREIEQEAFAVAS